MKKFWKSLLFTLALLTAFGILSSFAMAASPIKVEIDGKTLQMEVPPKDMGSRIMVPLRSIFETLGMEVNYNKGAITSTKGYLQIKMHVGRKEVYCDTQFDGPTSSDVAPIEINGVVYVPLRIVADCFGCQVDWDAKGNTVKIRNSILVKPYLPGYVSNKTVDLTNVPYYSEYAEYKVPDFGKAINYDKDVTTDASGYYLYDSSKVKEEDVLAYVAGLKNLGYEFSHQYLSTSWKYEHFSVRKGDIRVDIDINNDMSSEFRYSISILDMAEPEEDFY